MAMRRSTCALALLAIYATSNPTVMAQSLDGTFMAQTPMGPAVLTLEPHPDGTMGGSLTLAGYVMQVNGQVLGIQGNGYLMSDLETLGFGVQREENSVTFVLFGFGAMGQPNYAASQTLSMKEVTADELAAMATTTDAVVINRVELATERVQTIERQYGTKLPSGRYWYDGASGAWGYEGGPTLGFVGAGLDLPDPMPADVSGTGTGIFINGREIHVLDQLALVGILGVTYPGRYTLDARGNLSIEGGAFLVNLVQASTAAQQSSGRGGLYSGMGGTVGTDGSGGVLFYSRNASGGYNTYSN